MARYVLPKPWTRQPSGVGLPKQIVRFGNIIFGKCLFGLEILEMAKKANSQTKRVANRFYASSKISEYQFKRVLWSFVRDEAAAKAARHMTLSANSIDAIYGKLRAYFTELGLFYDIYQGGDPRDGTARGEDFEGYEVRLLAFHLDRMKGKRRMKATMLDEVDYNWCESAWRFPYTVLSEGRSSEIVDRMMFAHLLAHIRLCGPVGRKPVKLEESGLLDRQQFEQRLLWLERNAPGFRDEHIRADLREIRERPYDPSRCYPSSGD